MFVQSSKIPRDYLIDCLRDAHAMESQAVTLTTSQADRLKHYPDLEQRIAAPAFSSKGCLMNDRQLKGKRVLVVEDEPLIATMIEEQLSDIGCVVLGPFERIQVGLAAARVEPVDFALLDVNVAGEKVFPIAEVLEQRGVPFLFLTGYGDGAPSPDRPHWEALGKPFRAEQLAARLELKLKQSKTTVSPQ